MTHQRRTVHQDRLAGVEQAGIHLQRDEGQKLKGLGQYSQKRLLLSQRVRDIRAGKAEPVHPFIHTEHQRVFRLNAAFRTGGIVKGIRRAFVQPRLYVSGVQHSGALIPIPGNGLVQNQLFQKPCAVSRLLRLLKISVCRAEIPVAVLHKIQSQNKIVIVADQPLLHLEHKMFAGHIPHRQDARQIPGAGNRGRFLNHMHIAPRGHLGRPGKAVVFRERLIPLVRGNKRFVGKAVQKSRPLFFIRNGSGKFLDHF
ncbi:hypothetical protein DSECCO2_376360 [anaerobic digester metagenome]